ncbi:phospholipase/Carboxylesterase domain-containing protein [Sarocladium implicatum]|nr:phospholipase/Carboxylesterase domain-containing protein [Sarocladium implicatum]
MPVSTKAPTVYEAPAKHTATVIFVHGLGDSSENWTSIVEEWRSQGLFSEVKFVLPDAPTRPIAWAKGKPMTSWFDLTTVGGSIETFREDEDVEGIEESRAYFHRLIQKEVDAGVDTERIVLGGFSQGGAMSILSGLTSENKLGGIISLSSWLLRSNDFEKLVPEDSPNADTPVFMAQGTDDKMVKPALGKQSLTQLKGLGYDVTWEVYPDLGHHACNEELEDVQAFLEAQLEPLEKKPKPAKHLTVQVQNTRSEEELEDMQAFMEAQLTPLGATFEDVMRSPQPAQRKVSVVAATAA